MKILIRRKDFSTVHYDLIIEDAALEFAGEKDAFSLPYAQITDFVITRDSHEKSYFTMLATGQLYEGTILEAQEVENFSAALKDKLGGVIHIEVRRN